MILANVASSAGRTAGRWENAFTYTEVMVASSIFLLVIAGVISSHLFGLRMMEFSQTRMGANDNSRKAISLMLSEVRAAQSVRVGQMSGTNFVEASPYSAQKGKALQLYYTNDTNVYIRYYLDTTDKVYTNAFKRLAVPGNTNDMGERLLAYSVTAADIFSFEDYAGNTVSNRQTLCVLGLNLQFYQLNNPTILIGPTNYYTSYSVQAKICLRSSD
jgi:hypothetical protein